MSRNKFNLKDKKTKIIISVIVLCIILLGGLGFGLATLNSTESKDIAYNKDKVDKNNKVDKNKTENKKEENKKEDSKKEEAKVETSSTSTTTSAVENKSEGSKGTSNNTSTGSSSNSSSSNNNTSTGSSSSSSNSGVVNKPSNSGSSNSNSGAVSTPSTPSKPSTGGSSSSGSSSSGNTAKPEAHSHSWNPITTTVHHDEVGHWEDVLVQDAWSEYIPVYDEVEVEICNGCGADITADPYEHMEQQVLMGNLQCGGFTTHYKQVQVGTEEIKHGPVYDMKYVVDTPAWDETVTTGYQCSCGATK